MKHFAPEPAPKPCFATWLLGQSKRDDPVGDLAKAAHRDPRYPISGGFNDVAARLNKLEADPDMHVALEDAELEWLAY